MAAPEEETPRLPEEVKEEEEPEELPDPDFDPEAETNPEYSPPPGPPRPRPKRPKDMAAGNGGQLRGQAFLQTTFFSTFQCILPLGSPSGRQLQKIIFWCLDKMPVS